MGSIYSRITRRRNNNNFIDQQNVSVNSTQYRESIKDRPLKPTKRKKCAIVHDVSVFKDIDDHAKKAPNSVKASVKTLVEYLIRPTSNDIEKVRVIYKWIQLNVSYDVQSYLHGGQGPIESKDVLRQGRSVCSGYSNLFSDMCSFAGIAVKSVSGYAKGLSYDPIKGFKLSDKPNHEWNLVWLAGEWRFIDCTWGTGNTNSQMQFEMRNNEFYFLTDPKYFISTHFPYMNEDMKESLKYQLLKRPIDLETFNRRVHSTVPAFECGMKCLTHKDVTINVKGEVKIALGFSEEKMTIHAQLLHENGNNIKSCLMIFEDANKFFFRVRAPAIGKYKFEVYGNNDSGSILDLLVTYIITVEDINGNLRPFPDYQKPWGNVVALTEYGISQTAVRKVSFETKTGECSVLLPLLQTTSIMAKLAHAEKMIIDIDNYVILETTQKAIISKVRTPELGFYKLSIYGKRLDSAENKYDSIISYLIECKVKPNICRPFPKSSVQTILHQVSLLEPTHRDLQGSTDVTFKLKSPLLNLVLAANQTFNKDGDLFDFTLKLPYKGTKFELYGSDKDTGPFDRLFEFQVV